VVMVQPVDPRNASTRPTHIALTQRFMQLRAIRNRSSRVVDRSPDDAFRKAVRAVEGSEIADDAGISSMGGALRATDRQRTPFGASVNSATDCVSKSKIHVRACSGTVQIMASLIASFQGKDNCYSNWRFMPHFRHALRGAIGIGDVDRRHGQCYLHSLTHMRHDGGEDQKE